MSAAQTEAPVLMELHVQLPMHVADWASDALMELGALAVSIEDAQANTEHETPMFGEPGANPEQCAWPESRLSALCLNALQAEQMWHELCQLCTGLDDCAEAIAHAQVEYRKLPAVDWVLQTQSQFAPIEIAPKLWVVPSWHACNAETLSDLPGKHIILDPGMAFGTGSHPTTALCAQWLYAHLPEYATPHEAKPGDATVKVLDYGCGSGLLGIVAAMCGAKAGASVGDVPVGVHVDVKVLGIDIDPQALRSCQTNATQNGVDMPCGLPGFEDAHLPFDVVVANILSNPLKVLAPVLCARVRLGGALVLSGVLARQAEEVIAHYAPWATLNIWAEHDGWVCLVGTPLALSPTPVASQSK